jgi:hypothetical protein
VDVYRTTIPIATVAMVSGITLTGIDMLDGTMNGIGIIGLTLILATTVIVANIMNAHLVKEANRPADRAYELGYEMGYNAGWNTANAGEPVVDLKAV